MKNVARFTVSVPAELLEAVDEKLVKDEEGRSALVRRLLEQALREAQEAEDIARWIRGYEEHPQTEEEYGWVDAVNLEQFKEML